MHPTWPHKVRKYKITERFAQNDFYSDILTKYIWQKMKNIDIDVAKILLGFSVTALSMLIYGVSIFFNELWFRNWPQISPMKYIK